MNDLTIYLINNFRERQPPQIAQFERTLQNWGYQIRKTETIPEKLDGNKALIIFGNDYINQNLLQLGSKFLEKFDLMAPMHVNGKRLEDYGNDQEKFDSLKVTGDLRLVPYYPELFFIRNNAAGKRFLESFKKLFEEGVNPVHAFLRSVFNAKPKAYLLPIEWSRTLMAMNKNVTNSRLLNLPAGGNFVNVEVSPGRIVKVRKDQVEEFKRQKGLK